MQLISGSMKQSLPAEPLSQALRGRILAAASSVPPLPREGERPRVRATRRRLSPLAVGGVCVAFAAFAAITILPVFRQAHELARNLSMAPMAHVQALAVHPFKAPQSPQNVSDQNYAAEQPAAMPVPQRMARPKGGPGGVVVTGQPSYLNSSVPPPPARATDMNATVTSQIADLDWLDRQVHREASLTVQVKDPEAASDQIQEMVQDAGGYVAENDLASGDDDEKSAQMTLRVPVAQFDTVMAQIAHLGEVKSKNVTGEDITGKVSDAAQAESVLEDEVDRSNAHLAALGRHARWEDEEDAREVRIELAQARARLQLLHKLAALANISVNLTEKPKPASPAQTGFLSDLKGNGSAAYQSMLGTATALLTLVIWIVAYVPIWGPIAFAIWYARRYAREQRASM